MDDRRVPAPPPSGPGPAWVAPDTPADPAAAAPPGFATSPAATAPGVAPPPRRALPGERLRPRSVFDILDGAIARLVGAPATVIGVVAVFVVPVQFLAAYLTRSQYGNVEWGSLFDQTATFGSTSSAIDPDLAFLVSLLPLIVLPFAGGAIGHLMAAWQVGQRPTTGGVLGAVARSTPALLVSFVAIHVLEFGAAILLVFPGVMVMTLYMVTAPVNVVEVLGPFRGMSRSSALVRRRYWVCMGVALLVAVVNILLSSALGALSSALVGVDWSWVDDWGWLIGAAVGSVSEIVTTTFTAAAAVLLYLDMRVRTEGLDIELDATALFDRAA